METRRVEASNKIQEGKIGERIIETNTRKAIRTEIREASSRLLSGILFHSIFLYETAKYQVRYVALVFCIHATSSTIRKFKFKMNSVDLCGYHLDWGKKRRLRVFENTAPRKEFGCILE